MVLLLGVIIDATDWKFEPEASLKPFQTMYKIDET